MRNDRGIDPVDLDNYITGHWGEDQFKDEPEECDESELTDEDRTFDLPEDFHASPIDDDERNRIEKATEDAEYAFWNVVAKAFPECTTGDLDPDIVCNLRSLSRAAVERWVSLNRV